MISKQRVTWVWLHWMNSMNMACVLKYSTVWTWWMVTFRALLTQQTRNVQPRWIQHVQCWATVAISMITVGIRLKKKNGHNFNENHWAAIKPLVWIFQPGVCLSALSIDVAFYCYYVFQTLGPPNLQTRPTLYIGTLVQYVQYTDKNGYVQGITKTINTLWRDVTDDVTYMQIRRRYFIIAHNIHVHVYILVLYRYCNSANW